MPPIDPATANARPPPAPGADPAAGATAAYAETGTTDEDPGPNPRAVVRPPRAAPAGKQSAPGKSQSQLVSRRRDERGTRSITARSWKSKTAPRTDDETPRPWPSSTPFRSALIALTCSRTRKRPARIVDLLAKAGDRLDAAVNIHTTGQGDPADVVFLSYEAMFSCVRALVYAKGYREFGLRCLLLACDGLYVRTGQLDAEHLRKFELAQRLKMSPAEAVEASSAFVKRTLELLGQ